MGVLGGGAFNKRKTTCQLAHLPTAETGLKHLANGRSLHCRNHSAQVGADGEIGKPRTGAGLLLNRPPTRERDNGRVGLTVLLAHPDAMAATAARRNAEAGICGDNDDDGMGFGRPESPRTLGRGTASGLDGKGDGGAGGGEGGGGGGGGGVSSPGRQAVPLKVCIGPKRTRQIITFEDRIVIDTDASRPTLTMFEHVEGSKVRFAPDCPRLLPCHNDCPCDCPSSLYSACVHTGAGCSSAQGDGRGGDACATSTLHRPT